MQAIIAKLAHRGPDGKVIYPCPQGDAILAHRRLAIIDPERGSQPILSADGSSALVANGMIYNHRTLRSRLPAANFRSGSDSEVILHAVVSDGAEAVRKLDGMFAFVLVKGDSLLAARDPVGIKPLYVGHREDSLCFASEIKALLGVAERIEAIPPGHLYRSGQGIEPFWRIPASRPRRRPIGTVARELRGTLESAVLKRLQSDVPLGVYLSGGLDSSIVAAIARRHLDELKTFAVGMKGSRDLAAARLVADHLGTDHREYVLQPHEIFEALPKILYHLESFDRDLVRSAVPCYFVSCLAADYVKVVLTGEGADELFAGYSYYRAYDDPAALHEEIERSVRSMHNINLQRVDRMTMAHGLEGRVPFLDTEMIRLAMSIEPELKLRREGERVVEKWILRVAFEDLLPECVLWRDKEQFDEGSGVAELLAGGAAALGEKAAETADAPSDPGSHDAEERYYRALLAERFEDPEPVFDLVAHWADRPAP